MIESSEGYSVSMPTDVHKRLAPTTAQARASILWHISSMDDEVLGAFAAYQRAQDLAENTIRNRASILRTLRATIDTSLVDATVTQLRTFQGREGIKPGSRRTCRNALTAFYTFLVEDGYRDDNPAARLPVVRAPKGTARPFTPEQVDAMLESGAYARTRAMILLGYYQGFRVSSIAAVHGHDIDLLAGTIRSVVKGDKPLSFPLHPVIAELSRLMPADDWWFPARAGHTGHIHSSSVTNLITRAKHRAGITDPQLTPHSLRHSFGTDLVDHEIDIRVVQELMGHGSVATTEIYTRVSAKRKRDAIHVLPPRAIPHRSGRNRDIPPVAA